MEASSESLGNAVPLVVSVGVAIAQFISQVQRRFARVQEIKERGGKLGAWFWGAYLLFQYLYSVGLILFCLAGLAALVGGLLKFTGASWVPAFLIMLYDKWWLPIVGFTFLFILVIAFDVLSWVFIILIGWIPSKWLPLKRSTAWYNILQFSKLLEQPKPLFLNDSGIAVLADKAIERLFDSGAGAGDFAEVPAHLNADARANVALIGCLLEREHLLFHWPRRKWRPFYAAIAAAKENDIHMSSPDFLKGNGTKIDFYGVLRQKVNQLLPSEEPPLPESAQVTSDLARAIGLLTGQYKGSAKNIAYTLWRPKKPNLRVASDRATQFRPLDRESMIPQFLKVAVRWNVWPEVSVGNFIYPLSLTLAALLLESQVLVTLDKAERFAFQKQGEIAAFREGMRRTVKSAESLLSVPNQEQYARLVEQLNAAKHPMEWELATAVDFALWSLAGQMFKEGSFKDWTIDHGFVVRKAMNKDT